MKRFLVCLVLAVTFSGCSDSEETTVLRFLMAAAAQLSSSLELDKVFREIATGLRPLIDYHLFCVMLWNEETQLLENSFSMKYGEVIPQKGGFPMDYGLSGMSDSRTGLEEKVAES